MALVNDSNKKHKCKTKYDHLFYVYKSVIYLFFASLKGDC